MDNECPKCEKLPIGERVHKGAMCLDCQLEQADATLLQDMNRVEEIKQKIAKEKQNEPSKC